MSAGSIIRREGKTGVSWLLKYEGPRDAATGQRRQLYKTIRASKREAERELRRLLSEIDGGMHVDPHKTTLAQWIDIWIRDHATPTVAAKTVERYGELMRLHVAPAIGSTALLRITPPMIQTMLTKCMTMVAMPLDGPIPPKRPVTALSGQTTLHVYRCLSNCLSAAVRQRVLSRNPCDDVTPPRPRATGGTEEDGDAHIRALERDDLDRLMKGFKGRALFPIVAVAASTGMRRGEILALRWSDIDLDGCTIKIERSVEDTAEHGIRIKAPKTKGSRRTIGIDPALAAMLRGIRAQYAELSLAIGVRLGNDWLAFPGSPDAPATPRAPRAVTKEFSRRAKALGFSELRLHDLRHTHATLLLMAGVPINAVAARLGHASAVVTLGVYGHVLRRAEDQAVSVSAGLLKGVLDGA